MSLSTIGNILVKFGVFFSSYEDITCPPRSPSVSNALKLLEYLSPRTSLATVLFSDWLLDFFPAANLSILYLSVSLRSLHLNSLSEQPYYPRYEPRQSPTVYHAFPTLSSFIQLFVI